MRLTELITKILMKLDRYFQRRTYAAAAAVCTLRDNLIIAASRGLPSTAAFSCYIVYGMGAINQHLVFDCESYRA